MAPALELSSSSSTASNGTSLAQQSRSDDHKALKLEEVACACLNVRVRYQRDESVQGNEYGKVKVAEDGVVVALPFLVGKELAQVSVLGPSSLPRSALRCLHCSTSVYAVEKALSAGPARSIGFRSISGSGKPAATIPPVTTLEQQTYTTSSAKDILLRPHDGFVYLLPGSIGPKEIKATESSEAFSPVYGVSVSIASPNVSLLMAHEDTSSTRPSLQGQHRLSPYGQYTSATHFGLQSLPSSLIVSPADLPRSRSSSTSISGGQSGWVPHQISSTTVTTSSSSSAPSPLVTQLESVGLERLRQWRNDAEQEIVQMVRVKRKELDDLIKRAQLEGEAILEKVKTAPAPVPVTALMSASSSSEVRGRSNGIGRDGQSWNSSLAAPERESADQSSEAAFASAEASREVSREASPTLSDEAFQRRPTQASRSFNLVDKGGIGPHISSSLSALSASFAMRGREAPSAMDDWAQKRRLKERYPEGDHSVMTSAATSAANSFSDQGHLAEREEVEEEERRGRGRERAPRTESPVRAAPTASEAALSSTPMQNAGSAKVPPGTVSRPTMAPSSLNVKHFAKRPAITSIDTGATADDETPRPGGPLGGLASPSAQVHLRPRNPPPSGAEPLKPATRKSKALQSKSAEIKTKAERQLARGAEKKVAFAETTDQAASRRDYSDSDEEEEQKPLVDERGTAVFDIDEELERGDNPDDARADAVQSAAESIQGVQIASELGIEGPVEGETDDDDDGSRSDLDDDDLGGMRASVGARQAGSFAALAEFGRTRAAGRVPGSVLADLDADADAFDPASIRLDGRVVVPGDSSPKKRSGSRSREVSRDQIVSRLTDFEDETVTSNKRRGLDWNRRKTAIGYRSTIGDAELRLSGLLAPHAPSHRNLWIKERRKSEQKYILASDEGEDKEPSSEAEGGDQLWFAWQQRAKEIEDESSKRHRDLAGISSGTAVLMASSMPADRGTGSATSAAIPMFRQTSDTTTTVYDETSGFDREPKTSLPYQERQMVPSLRKATRRPTGPARRLSQLPTIADAEMGDDAKQNAAKSEPGRPRAESKAGDDGAHAKLASQEISRNTVGSGNSLPGSVLMKGFGPGGSATKVTSQVDAHLTSPSHTQHPNRESRGLGLALGIGTGVGSAAQSPHFAIVRSGVSTGYSTPGSRSPHSVRRSPRPPYVPPPPPTSTSIVLTPDPLMKPGPLRLFTTAPDTRFAYNEQGEENETDWSKVLSFMHRVEQLKTNKRTGWFHHRVPLVESIADHMYRMAILAMLCPNEGIDLGRCVMLALVHDLAEAEVGDLTPLDNVPKEEKIRRESEALAYLVHDLLGSSPAGLRIEALWNEYEDRKTLESILVKDLDRFELLLQALEYEGRYDIVDLQPFFSCAGEITHPRIRKWAVELAKEREALWSSKGEEWAFEQKIVGSVSGEKEVVDGDELVKGE